LSSECVPANYVNRLLNRQASFEFLQLFFVVNDYEEHRRFGILVEKSFFIPMNIRITADLCEDGHARKSTPQRIAQQPNRALGSLGKQVDIEILTAGEVAEWLKISKAKVYEMTNLRTRTGDLRKHPLPAVRFDGVVRFRKSDVEAWLEKLARR
jgi:excisionase family DNA binding protein